VLAAHVGIEPGMVGQGVDAQARQPDRGLVDLAPRLAVDDAGRALMPVLEEAAQLLARGVLLDHPVADVRPVEARHEHTRVVQPEPVEDLLPGDRIGGGRQRNARDRREALVQHRQLDVFRSEVVAPLRHAVRLVDREQRDLRTFEQREEAFGEQPFRRDIQQVEFARFERLLHLARRARIQRRVEEGRVDAGQLQRIDLVLHQRDQRRHHHAGTGAHDRRDLVAQRLAAAGGHQHQRVATVDQVADDLLLVAAEFPIAEHPAQDFPGAGDAAVGHPGCRGSRGLGSVFGSDFGRSLSMNFSSADSCDDACLRTASVSQPAQS